MTSTPEPFPWIGFVLLVAVVPAFYALWRFLGWLDTRPPMRQWQRFRRTPFGILWQICMVPFIFHFRVAGPEGLSAGAAWFNALGLAILCGALSALGLTALWCALLVAFHRSRQIVLAARRSRIPPF